MVHQNLAEGKTWVHLMPWTTDLQRRPCSLFPCVSLADSVSPFWVGQSWLEPANSAPKRLARDRLERSPVSPRGKLPTQRRMTGFSYWEGSQDDRRHDGDVRLLAQQQHCRPWCRRSDLHIRWLKLFLQRPNLASITMTCKQTAHFPIVHFCQASFWFSSGHLYTRSTSNLGYLISPMMPSSLLGCASQFVRGLYPTLTPYGTGKVPCNHVFMYIYICIYTHVYIIHTHAKSYTYIYIHMYIYIYDYMCHIHIHHIYICMDKYIYIYM